MPNRMSDIKAGLLLVLFYVWLVGIIVVMIVEPRYYFAIALSLLGLAIITGTAYIKYYERLVRKP